MSDDTLTPDEASEAGDLIRQLLPMVGLLVLPLRDPDTVDLLKRSLKAVNDHHAFLDAAMPAHLAMGIDTMHDPAIRNQKQNVPILRKVLELRDMVLQAESDAAADDLRDLQRSVMLRGLGML